MNRQVVVTGIGIVSPLESGKGNEAFWQGLLSGKDTVKEVVLFDTKKYECHAAGELEGF